MVGFRTTTPESGAVVDFKAGSLTEESTRKGWLYLFFSKVTKRCFNLFWKCVEIDTLIGYLDTKLICSTERILHPRCKIIRKLLDNMLRKLFIE